VNFLSDSGSVCGLLELKTCHAEKDELFEIAEDRRLALKPHCGGYYHGKCLDECGQDETRQGDKDHGDRDAVPRLLPHPAAVFVR